MLRSHGLGGEDANATDLRGKIMPCLASSQREATIPETVNWPLRSDLTLGPLPSAVPCARAHAVACLWEWGLSGAGDTVALVVSELITNSVAASRALDGGPFPVLLRMLSDRSEILIMVSDASPEQPGRMNPADDAEGGRGLMLVEAVSKRWDWYAVPRGKVVWALCTSS